MCLHLPLFGPLNASIEWVGTGRVMAAGSLLGRMLEHLFLTILKISTYVLICQTKRVSIADLF